MGSVRPAAMLVRGTDAYGNFQAVKPATDELSAEALATHAWAVDLYRDAYLEEEARHESLPA